MEENKELRDFLYRKVMRGEWREVVEKYREEGARAQGIEVMPTKDTALHMAAFYNQEEIVAELVTQICSTHQNNKYVLAMTNDSGNTPLHIAAALGSAKMCDDIASANPEVVDQRNENGETPLFLAARFGHKHVFYCLLYFCGSDLSRVTSNSKNRAGDTVLHCALRNQQFDLAFQIISMNKKAINWVDGKRLTPLHILADDPTVFKSRCPLRGLQRMVCNCTSVEQLKPESLQTLSQLWKKTLKPKTTDLSFPHNNYATCIQFFTNLLNGFLTVLSSLKRQVVKKNDEGDKEKEKDLENKLDVGEEIGKDFNTNDNEAHQDQLSDPRLIKPELAGKPSIRSTCFEFFKTIFIAIMTILSFLGFIKIERIRKVKEKHTWSVQVMEELLKLCPEKYLDDGLKLLPEEDETVPYTIEGDVIGFSENGYPKPETNSKDVPVSGGQVDNGGLESAMILAVKNGAVEIVRKVLECFPEVIIGSDISENGRRGNLLQLAVQYRQPTVLRFLGNQKHYLQSISMSGVVDNDGNNALHLAAQAPLQGLGHISGIGLQMLMEVKWFLFAKKCVPREFSTLKNNKGQTPQSIFTETHKWMVDEAAKWYTSSTQSCSVVSALIATVAFASAATVPGGNASNGYPVLEEKKAFLVYAISSLIALSLSLTSVIMFLAIWTSLFRYSDFRSNLPRKLLIALSSLYFSIIAMFISFCAAHFFLLSHTFHNVAVFLYVLIFLPITIVFTISHLPLCFALLLSIRVKEPKRRATPSYRPITHPST